MKSLTVSGTQRVLDGREVYAVKKRATGFSNTDTVWVWRLPHSCPVETLRRAEGSKKPYFQIK